MKETTLHWSLDCLEITLQLISRFLDRRENTTDTLSSSVLLSFVSLHLEALSGLL